MLKKFLLASVVLLAGVGQSFGAPVFSNLITGTNPNTANPYVTGQVVVANLSASGIGRGAGAIGTNANDRYNANSFDTASIDTTAFFTWTLTPAAGYSLSLNSLAYTGQRSGTGPNNFAFRSSLDGFASNITAFVSGVAGTTSNLPYSIDLSSPTFQSLTTATEFRLYAWNARNATNVLQSGGTFSVNDFVFDGSVSAVPEPTSMLFGGVLSGAGLLAARRRRKAKLAAAPETTVA